MIGKLTRMAFEAWLKTDEAWREVASDVVRELADDDRFRAIVFRGDDGSYAQPTLGDMNGEGDLWLYRYGWFDAKLASVPGECEAGARFAFREFVKELDHALEGGGSEGMFPGVMLYIRSKSAEVRRSGMMRKVYAIKLTDPDCGGGGYVKPKMPYLPWAFTSEGRARAVLEDAATTIAANLPRCWWETYRLVVSDGQCRIEAPLPPPPDRRKQSRVSWQPIQLRILTVESVMVPEDICGIPTDEGDFLVMDWSLALTKNWSTRDMAAEEWLDELDPMKSDGLRVEKCDWWKVNLDKLTPYQWMTVLRYRPDLAEKCPCWVDFSDLMWCVLLRRQPQFETRFKNWNRLPPHLWTLLLRRQPRLVKHFPATSWYGFTPWNWSHLLKDQPLFAYAFKDWDQFDGNDWCRLLARQPQFAERCDWSKFDFASVDGNEWTNLVLSCPEFLEKAKGHPEIWAGLSVENWRTAFARIPMLERNCDFSAIDGDMAADLLLCCPPRVHSVLVRRLTSWQQWFRVLSERPAFWAECKKRLNWDSLSESQLVDVLIDHPDAIQFVDTRKIKGKVNLWRLGAVRKEFNTEPILGKGSDSAKSWQRWDALGGIVHAVPVKGDLFGAAARFPCESMVVLTLPHGSRVIKDAYGSWCRMNRVEPAGLTKCPAGCNVEYVRGAVVPMERDDYANPPRFTVSCRGMREVLEKVLTELTESGVASVAINGIAVNDSNGQFVALLREWFATHETSIRVVYLVDRDGSFRSQEGAGKEE